jgi:hypothetical protein
MASAARGRFIILGDADDSYDFTEIPKFVEKLRTPITLHPDGRTAHLPHLKTFRDGWWTVRFFLVCSPRWLFLVPGGVIILLGLAGYAVAMPGLTLRTPYVPLNPRFPSSRLRDIISASAIDTLVADHRSITAAAELLRASAWRSAMDCARRRP